MIAFITCVCIAIAFLSLRESIECVTKHREFAAIVNRALEKQDRINKTQLKIDNHISDTLDAHGATDSSLHSRLSAVEDRVADIDARVKYIEDAWRDDFDTADWWKKDSQ